MSAQLLWKRVLSRPPITGCRRLPRFWRPPPRSRCFCGAAGAGSGEGGGGYQGGHGSVEGGGVEMQTQTENLVSGETLKQPEMVSPEDFVIIYCDQPKTKEQFWKEKMERTYIGLLVFGLIGAAVMNLKYTMEMSENARGAGLSQDAGKVGKAQVGLEGWTMIDMNGKSISNLDLLGKYTLMYFGFSFCPDVCPREMKKFGEIIDLVRAEGIKIHEEFVPLFVSVDPRRDSPEVIKKYCAQFHPDIFGITGTFKQLDHFANVMKTYFSQPPELGVDYILEHSTYMYFTDKEGNFVDITRSDDDAQTIRDLILKWTSQDKVDDKSFLKKLKFWEK